MEKQKLAIQKPKPSAITVTDAQNLITLLIRQAYFETWDIAKINIALREIINNAAEGLPLESLVNDTRRSLYNHANRVSLTLREKLDIVKVRAAILENNALKHSKFQDKILESKTAAADIGYRETPSGMPLTYWNAGEYIRKRVLPVMDELSRMNALDPNDFSGRNSLRNLAEMEVRYHNHELDVYEQRKNGEKLVVCSVHADCSKRCAPYQGRVYSLDGTSGITDDGREYVPLEAATQNPDDRYATKAGKVYQNGLLGFNCRHKLRPYISGVKPEEIPEKEREKQYAINNEQRERERKVRELNLKSDLYKGIDSKAYKEIRGKYELEAAEYKEFCKENERAFYPERLQVLKPSNAEERAKYREIEFEKVRYVDNLREMQYNMNNRLPNAIAARTPKEKFVNYALDINHKDGKDKAFVIDKVLGYNPTNWEELANKVFNASQTATVIKKKKTEHGESYTVSINVGGLKDREMNLHAVWFYDNGSIVPRLISLVPGKKEKEKY